MSLPREGLVVNGRASRLARNYHLPPWSPLITITRRDLQITGLEQERDVAVAKAADILTECDELGCVLRGN